MEKGVGQKRPGLRPAAQHMQFPDLSRLLQRGRVSVRSVDEIDQPIGPDGYSQPARNECVVPDDSVLDRHRSPIEGRVDSDENGDQAKDHTGRFEHRFAAARDPARLVCAHTRSSLSVANPDAPLVEAGTDAARRLRPRTPAMKTRLNRRCGFGEFWSNQGKGRAPLVRGPPGDAMERRT